MGGIDIPAGQGVGVYAEGNGWIAVAHAVGDGHHVDVIGQKQSGVGVPLGYNNDKTGNPYGTRLLSESDCKLQFLFHENEGGSEPVREG